MASRPRPLTKKRKRELVRRWNSQLNSRIPLLRRWLNPRGLAGLVALAVKGDFDAAESLALAATHHPDPAVLSACRKALRQVNHQTALNGVWVVWERHRSPDLLAFLLEKGRPASDPVGLRVLSRLVTGKGNSLHPVGLALMPALLQALNDRHPLVAENARRVLSSLKDQPAVDALCHAWVVNRSSDLESLLVAGEYIAGQPPQARVLTALKLSRPELLVDSPPQIITPLIEAMQDRDEQITRLARLLVRNLKSQLQMDEVCRIWFETRSPELAEVILQSNYTPEQPLPVFVFTMLKTGRLETLYQSPPEILPALLQALKDVDSDIRTASRQILYDLQSQSHRDALCRIAIERPQSSAESICRENGYRPEDPALLALYLFVTGQWQEYETHDFDRRHLRAAYAAAQPELRERILRALQETGRLDFLDAIKSIPQAVSSPLTPQEIQLQVQIFTARLDWESLWRLSQECDPHTSVRIVQTLLQTGFSPDDSDQQTLYQTLARLSTQALELEAAILTREITTPARKAVLRLSGRINDFSFSPDLTHLAIATGNRSVVIWNLKMAAVAQILRGFRRSIGLVEYDPAGLLWIAERTTSSDPCSLYGWNGEETRVVGSHDGSITLLHPLTPGQVIAAGKDERLRLWSFQSSRRIIERNLGFWPRAFALNPVKDRLALFTSRLHLFTLPGLEPEKVSMTTAQKTRVASGMVACASFDQSASIWVGHHNRQLVRYQSAKSGRWTRSLISSHPSGLRAIRDLPNFERVLVAEANGTITAYPRADQEEIQSYFTQPGLTAIEISPEDTFMAVGAQLAGLILYDFRVFSLPKLWHTPLSQIDPRQVAVLSSFQSDHLSPLARLAVEYITVLCQHRYRFDIHISDLPMIHPGQFDIVISE